jgi:hypothetical protein
VGHEKGKGEKAKWVGKKKLFVTLIDPHKLGTLTIPGHEWPGYIAAPDQSGFSPIHGASFCSPVIYRRGYFANNYP